MGPHKESEDIWFGKLGKVAQYLVIIFAFRPNSVGGSGSGFACFLGLPDPDPLVRGTGPALDPDPHVFGPPGS